MQIQELAFFVGRNRYGPGQGHHLKVDGGVLHRAHAGNWGADYEQAMARDFDRLGFAARVESTESRNFVSDWLALTCCLLAECGQAPAYVWQDGAAGSQEWVLGGDDWERVFECVRVAAFMINRRLPAELQDPALPRGRGDIDPVLAWLKTMPTPRRPDALEAALLEQAAARGIPASRPMHHDGVTRFGQGHRLVWFAAPWRGRNSAQAVAFCQSLRRIRNVFHRASVHVALQEVVSSVEQAADVARRWQMPVILRPMEAQRESALAAPVPITTPSQLQTAWSALGDSPGEVLVETCIPGRRFMVLVLGGELVAVVEPDADTRTNLASALHPATREQLLRAVRLLGLTDASVVLMLPAVDESIVHGTGIIHRVDACPELTPFLQAGMAGLIAGCLLDQWFAEEDGRIPTVAVTGTNGKTTTSTLLDAMFRESGVRTGRCSSTGVFVDGLRLVDADMTGAGGVYAVLGDDSVEAGILEMARGGMINNGLAFDRVDVGAVLNVSDDHLGLDGIETLDDLARIKALVAHSASDCVVLNAEDPRCVAMAAQSPARRHGWVARSRAALEANARPDDLQAWLDSDGCLRLRDGGEDRLSVPVADIPLALGSAAHYHVDNALFAMACARALNLDTAVIRQVLTTFDSTLASLPARANRIDGFPFTVLLDYAHNVAGFAALDKLMEDLGGRRRLMVLGFSDKRSEQYFRDLAPAIPQFDQALLYKLASNRARQNVVVPGMRDYLLADGRAADSMAVIESEEEAVRQIIAEAQPGDLVVIIGDDLEATTALLATLSDEPAQA